MSTDRSRTLASLACCVAALAGCAPDAQLAAPMPMPPSALRPLPAAEAPPQPQPPLPQPEAALPEGLSVQGKPLRCSVHGDGDQAVLILGGIHGSEPAGVTLCRQLESSLRRDALARAARRVVVAPALNPDGLAAGRRTNAHGVDINRNFDTRNRTNLRRHGTKALSEPEARYVAELIRRYRPARIVTIHQPLACVDYDGPARDLAAAVSRACGLPVRKLGARPGSLGSYAGNEKGIPIITLELSANATDLSPSALWRLYGPALLTAIRFPQPAGNDTDPPPPAPE